MKKMLLTAFEPFGGETVNPSQEVARRLGRGTFDNIQVEPCELPVDRFAAIEQALSRMHDFRPDVVLMLGEAGGRACLTLERIAVNLDDFRIPDRNGNQPRGEPIVADGPAEYRSTLPVDDLVEALTREQIPVAASVDAGRYLCNRLFYCVMHAIATEHLPMRAGFVHLPYLPEQVADKNPGTPSMQLETQLKALCRVVHRSAQI